MMNTVLEFHDSNVQSVGPDGNEFKVLFSAAYLHMSVGRPGIDAGEGHTQAADLTFHDASFEGDLDQCVGRLSDGCVSIVASGEALDGLPLPFNSSGPVRAEFTFQNGASLAVNATSATCSVSGPSKFVEMFPG